MQMGLGWHIAVIPNTWERKGEPLQGVKLPLNENHPDPFPSKAWLEGDQLQMRTRPATLHSQTLHEGFQKEQAVRPSPTNIKPKFWS